MDTFGNAMSVMKELFAKDCQLALATSSGNKPSVRIIDTYYQDGSFFVVTYAKSQKIREIRSNSQVSLCKDLYRFSGNAFDIGHPLSSANKDIRDKLISVFSPWYFEHNDESDENMCYVRIDLAKGFFYKDGMGYKVDFLHEHAERLPFNFEIIQVGQ